MNTLILITLISLAVLITAATYGVVVFRRCQKKRNESLNMMASLLRTLPAGEQQKTFADTLSNAGDLSAADLQQTNLQYVYLGNKVNKVRMLKADLYQADLSYAVIENVDARGAIFTRANLTGAKFINVTLLDANFSDATNVPADIKAHLNEKGICVSDEPITTIFATDRALVRGVGCADLNVLRSDKYL
jgi:hypothetical protein